MQILSKMNNFMKMVILMRGNLLFQARFLFLQMLGFKFEMTLVKDFTA